MTENNSGKNPEEDYEVRGSEFAKIGHPKKRAFLSAFSQVGTVTQAAAVAGISRESHRLWRQQDPEYGKGFEEAKAMACDSLEGEALRRAKEGVEEPVFHQGQKVGTTRKYSDTLLIFLLKGAMPHKYRESRFLPQPEAQASTPDTKEIESKYNWSRLSNDEWAELKRVRVSLKALLAKAAVPAAVPGAVVGE